MSGTHSRLRLRAPRIPVPYGETERGRTGSATLSSIRVSKVRGSYLPPAPDLDVRCYRHPDITMLPPRYSLAGIGAPVWTRTRNLPIRRRRLYPVELLALSICGRAKDPAACCHVLDDEFQAIFP